MWFVFIQLIITIDANTSLSKPNDWDNYYNYLDWEGNSLDINSEEHYQLPSILCFDIIYSILDNLILAELDPNKFCWNWGWDWGWEEDPNKSFNWGGQDGGIVLGIEKKSNEFIGGGGGAIEHVWGWEKVNRLSCYYLRAIEALID